MHTEHVSLIEDIVNSFINGELTADEAIEELKNVDSKATYPYWVTILAFGMAGAFRTLMFGGQIIDGIASVIAGICMGIFVQALNSNNTFTFLVNSVSYTHLFSVISDIKITPISLFLSDTLEMTFSISASV